MNGFLLELQWTEVSLGLLVALVLTAILLIPFLMKEIREGKREFGPLRRLRNGRVILGPQTPTGTGDYNPGRSGDPAPGQPDAQADPYGERAQRNAPPIRS
jgi:hypothetical protein